MNVEAIRTQMAAAFFLILVGAWFGYFIASRSIQHTAIEQDCAHYNTKTGEFTWGNQ